MPGSCTGRSVDSFLSIVFLLIGTTTGRSDLSVIRLQWDWSFVAGRRSCNQRPCGRHERERRSRTGFTPAFRGDRRLRARGRGDRSCIERKKKKKILSFSVCVPEADTCPPLCYFLSRRAIACRSTGKRIGRRDRHAVVLDDDLLVSSLLSYRPYSCHFLLLLLLVSHR